LRDGSDFGITCEQFMRAFFEQCKQRRHHVPPVILIENLLVGQHHGVSNVH
jgi:hypothetical protein